MSAPQCSAADPWGTAGDRGKDTGDSVAHELVGWCDSDKSLNAGRGGILGEWREGGTDLSQTGRMLRFVWDLVKLPWHELFLFQNMLPINAFLR